jgi:hypothetical protein
MLRLQKIKLKGIIRNGKLDNQRLEAVETIMIINTHNMLLFFKMKNKQKKVFLWKLDHFIYNNPCSAMLL